MVTVRLFRSFGVRFEALGEAKGGAGGELDRKAKWVLRQSLVLEARLEAGAGEHRSPDRVALEDVLNLLQGSFP